MNPPDYEPPEESTRSVPDDAEPTLEKRDTSGDAWFGLALAVAVSLGLAPLTGTDPDLRYTVTWGLLAGFGILAWLLGDFPRIEQEVPEDLAWGVALALILGIPLLAFSGNTLNDITGLMFHDLKPGTVLAYVVFVMPLAETLFFRGLLQQTVPFWQAALTATVWHLLLFFPLVNAGPFPLIVAIIMLMLNMMYGYVRTRNGLAAAWLCQITANLLLLFFPFI